MAATHPPATAPKKISPFEKEAYREKAEAQLKRWRARLVEMEAKGRDLGADVKQKYTEYRKQLQHQIEKTDDAIETLKAVGEDTWEDAKIRVEYLWEGLEDTWAYWTNLLKNSLRK